MFFKTERIDRILDELQQYIHPESEQITSFIMKPGNFNGGEEVNLDTSGWGSFEENDRWGGKDQHFWFRTRVKIPEKFAGKSVEFEVKTGRENDWDAINPQFLIYVNGRLIQGLDVNHREILLCENASAGEEYSIALHAYSGMKDGLVELKCRISEIDTNIEKLYYHLKVPNEITKFMDDNDKKKADILNYLIDAINMLDLRKPFSDTFYTSVKNAIEFMEEEFYTKYCKNSEVIAHCVGHTHIDVAWLWTVAQTREKVARSFSTVLNLMKHYPEYTFMSSQPQLYKFIKEDHPAIFHEIKERINEGRWEPEGAMWLEADCNLSSGESLVRQILFGTRFFEKEFGVKNEILWLPDVFGYSAALPQILTKSGIKYFMTTKLSWNEYNKIPYDTFMWQGIDGTEILTHFITTGDINSIPDSHRTTYNGDLIPSNVAGAWKRYQQKDLNSEVLICYGYGDGGGGPTKEMLENARRMSKGIPGCPMVKTGKSLDFFKTLEERIINARYLPKWVGELYLEYHRGTYTSMARNKRYNRKSELLYQDAEFLSVMGSDAAQNMIYPKNQINSGWETILLNQFHDILPGSSIKEVYETSENQYLEILNKGRSIADAALEAIASNICLDSASVVVFNQLSFERSDVVEFELQKKSGIVKVLDGDRLIPSQVVKETGEDGSVVEKVIFFACNVPAKGYKSFKLIVKENNMDTEPSTCNISSNTSLEVLSNRFFDVKFDNSYNLCSIYDKINGREVLKPGQKGNILQVFEDKPHNFDAWDINIYYQEKMWEINDIEGVEVLENGPVRNTLRISRKFLDSTLLQDIRIYNDIPRIDFSTKIDWKEKQLLLKAAFPVDIHADKASYEIQYGNVERPTHWNTSWDYARFEVCAHKWADLSEDNYGVSLLNDCKYGHDIKDGIMRLTLLKSATDPNPDADRELHQFTYSIYPHCGNWKKANTVQMAYSLNCPMYAKVEQPHKGTMPPEFSLVSINRENVIIEVIKKAEDSGDIIIRVYECYNRRTKATLNFFRKFESIWECDLMENNIRQIESDAHSFTFEIMPYEILTFKLH